MKTLISIILVLILSPAIAQSDFLYGKSGGYETSGGYEKSGGYETSGGYEKSGGYELTDNHQRSREGYEKFVIDNPEITRRIVEKNYDEQISKTTEKRKRWIDERLHRNGLGGGTPMLPTHPTQDYLQSFTRNTGGVDRLE